MTDKKGLVPIVTQEVGFALQAELNQEGPEYFGSIFQRLFSGDNPAIAKYLYNLVEKLPEDKTIILHAGLGVYRLLESQAEADKMTRELG